MTLTKVSSSMINESSFNVLDYGAKGDGVTDDGAAIQDCLNAAAVNGGRVLFPNTGSNYMTSKFLLVSGKVIIEFLGSDSYLTLTADDGGGLISALENADVTYINPRLDSGGPALLGQNGIGTGKNATTTVVGGHIRNCRAFDSFDYSGGRAINIDGWDGAKVSVFGTKITDCDLGLSHKRDVFYAGKSNSFTASSVTIENCVIALHAYASNAVGDDSILTSFTGITIKNCGAPFGSVWSGGIIAGSAARNAKIQAVVVNDATYNSGTPVNCIIRGRWKNSSFDVTVKANCSSIVDFDISPDIWWAGNAGVNSEANTYKLNAPNANSYDQIFYTSTGAIETIPYSSYAECVLREHPSVQYISTKIGDGSMFFNIVNDDRYIACSGNVLASTFNTYANLPTYQNPPLLTNGTWSPSYSGTSGSAGSLAYAERTGRWTKIGNRVFINGVIILSNKGSWTGNVVIGALPFSAAGSSGYESYGVVDLRSVTFSEKYAVFEIARTDTDTCRIKLIDTGTDGLQLSTAGVANNSGFLFSLSYETA